MLRSNPIDFRFDSLEAKTFCVNVNRFLSEVAMMLHDWDELINCYEVLGDIWSRSEVINPQSRHSQGRTGSSHFLAEQHYYNVV